MKMEQLPRPIGYVFGGGGSRGAIQVGMLQALSEHSILPDLVTGTSVGALNGAVVALDPKGSANRLSHLWARITRDEVFPGGLLTQLRTLEHSRTHLFPNSGLSTVIERFFGDRLTFADLSLPFGAVTTDIASGRAHVIEKGPLTSALLASAAIPGIFPRVDRDGLILCDGGVVSNVPMGHAIAMGARSLIVLDCFPVGCLPGPQESLAEVLLSTVMIAMRAPAASEATGVAEQVPVLYLPCSTSRVFSPLDFSYTAELIESAYETTRPFLDSVDVAGPGLYGPSSEFENRWQ